MKQKIYVVGIGPGAPEMMTPQARQALEESDVIAGYQVYIKLLGDLVQNKNVSPLLYAAVIQAYMVWHL